MSFGDDLLADIQQIRATYPLLELLKRDVYLRNLVLLFHMMRASEHLLETAINASEANDLLLPYFVEHVNEERGHEEWLRDDIASAGIDVLKTMVPRSVVEMVGSQYYLIHHLDSAALLGYMAVLECFPARIEDINAIELQHGQALTRTVRYHAIHDLDHGADLVAVMNSLPPERQALVRQSALQAALYLRSAIALNV